MSQLILTLISVALIGLVALGTLNFVGDAFTDGAEDAEIARYLNEAGQIGGAVRLYQQNNLGNPPADLEGDLVPFYLTEMPKAAAGWSMGDDVLIRQVDNSATCESINTRAGMADPTPKSCTDPSLAGATYFCCVE